MRNFFKRRLCVLVTVLLLVLSCSGDSNAEVTLEKRRGEIWNAVYLWPEEEKVQPNIVVVYLHGSSDYGRTLQDLDRLNDIEHPVRYAREGKLYLPDDIVFVCPQAHSTRDFRDNQGSKLCKFIADVKKEFPNATVILAGHSMGAVSAYKLAANGYGGVDGYVFISGNRPVETNKLPFITNAFVAFGTYEVTIDRRGDFSALFCEHAVSSRTYKQESYFLEEDAHNAYMTIAGGHALAARVILEESFWEWLYEVA